MTPAEILAKCGLKDFKPPAEDTPESAVARAQAMQHCLKKVVERARVAEGFLSDAMVRGTASIQKKPHLLMAHELAKARQSFTLVGQRQSRVDAWRTYAQLVQNHVTKHAEDNAGAEDVATLRPSFVKLDDGKRAYQFCAVREHVLGEVMPALVEEVFRLSAKKTGGPGKKLCPGSLETRLCGWVTLRLLEEVELEGQAGIFRCTLLHKRLGVDPSSIDKGSPQLLFQIPASEACVEEHPSFLQVRFSKNVQESLTRATGCDFSLREPKDAADENKDVFYTYDAFSNSASGIQNVKKYMLEMAAMYSKTTGGSLCDEGGRVQKMVAKSCPSPPLRCHSSSSSFPVLERSNP